MSIEEDVGITCYIREDLSGFTGILKQRYTDFLVNEVSEQGQVLHLTSTDIPVEDSQAPPLAVADGNLSGLLDKVAGLLGQDQADKLDTWIQVQKQVLAQQPQPKNKRQRLDKRQRQEQQQSQGVDGNNINNNNNNNSSNGEQHVDGDAGATAALDPKAPLLLGPVQGGKEERTAVHMLFKGVFEDVLSFETTTVQKTIPHTPPQQPQPTTTTTNDGADGGHGVHGAVKPSDGGDTNTATYIKVVVKQVNKGRGGKRSRDDTSRDRDAYWPGGQGRKHVSFLLHKTNMDTGFAVSLLGRYLQVGSNAVCVAGTKDKRAVTVQQITCQRVTATRVAHASSKIEGIVCGNYAYTAKPAALGAQGGNAFQIILRDVQGASDEQVASALQGLSMFVNYFGLQRFGDRDLPTHRVGASLLKGDWKKTCEMLLEHRRRDKTEITEARNAYRAGNINKALRVLPKMHIAERALLEGFKKHGPTAYEKALRNIPRNLRTLYAHAYQSYLWNAAASHRIRVYGVAAAVAGDLVLRGRDAGSGDAGGVADGGDCTVGAMVDVGDGNGGVGEGGEGIEEHLKDGGVSLEVSLGRSTARLAAVHEVTQEEADAGVYDISDVVLPLPGKHIRYPNHTTKDVYHTLAAQDGVDLNQHASDIVMMNSGGDYRHVIQRPINFAYRLFRYDEPNIDLATCDWDILEHKRQQQGQQGQQGGGQAGGQPGDAQQGTVGDGSSQPTSAASQPTSAVVQTPVLSQDSVLDAAQVPQGKLLGLRLQFQLPSSCYATMLLRELMKGSTATAVHANRTKNAMMGRAVDDFDPELSE